CVWCVLSSFTISSIAPTLFGRNTENCFTSGPSSLELVWGRLAVIWMMAARTKLMWTRQTKLSHCRCFVGKRNMLVGEEIRFRRHEKRGMIIVNLRSY